MERATTSGSMMPTSAIDLAICLYFADFFNSGEMALSGRSCDTGSVIYDSSFAFAGGNVFIGCVSGQFNAIDAATGKIVWKYRLAPGHLLASPATDEKNVYIGTMSGQIVALPATVQAVAQAGGERAR